MCNHKSLASSSSAAVMFTVAFAPKVPCRLPIPVLKDQGKDN
jgi:hypothetical protein